MAKQNQERETDDKKGSPPEAEPWGTWEELLLAYAVNRFGTNSWDSISSELRKRSSAAIVFTPKHCKQKYLELQRRFAQSVGDDVDMDDGGDTTTVAAVPWIEELRKLRVEELQRQLQNFDIYISSLQLKVKKLSEGSEKNIYGERKRKPDQEQKTEEIEMKKADETNNKGPKPMKSEESERDKQSVNGSNGNLETGEKSENESSPLYTVDEKPESWPQSAMGVESCEAKEAVKTEPDWGASQAAESIAESKSEGSIKEYSDVSSRKDKVVGRVDEREKEDQLRDTIPVRSLPLIDILQKVYKLGSAVFERRLDRQEKARYRKMVREHIDSEVLQRRLKEGWYSNGNNKFFRDLLLLVNNACIFFPNQSPEAVAAIQLRQFVMASKTKQISSKPPELAPMNMIVCRKRSTIVAKASSDKKEASTKKNSDGFPLPLISKKTGKQDQEKEKGKSSASENSDTNKLKNDKLMETEEKKRSVAKLLHRMNSTSDDAHGGSENESRGGGEQKRGGKGKKDLAPQRRRRNDADSPARRSVGRPPKKALGKRNRECAESESSVSKQVKKKSKR